MKVSWQLWTHANGNDEGDGNICIHIEANLPWDICSTTPACYYHYHYHHHHHYYYCYYYCYYYFFFFLLLIQYPMEKHNATC